MAGYYRVTYEDRCQIRAFLQVERSVKGIAKQLGFDKSTIYREIARNGGSGVYRAARAEDLAKARRQSCRRRFLISEELEGQILALLFTDWSPEQIGGRLAQEGVASISHQTIYNYIHANKRALWPYRRRFNRRGASRLRMKAHKRTGKLSIDLRPKICNQRLRIGDWERDCMYGSQGKQILVCTDRKSRLCKIAKVKRARVIDVNRLTNRLLRATKRRVYTITNDNGPEFRHPRGAMAPVYYCYPRRPQQRGTVENTVGLLRQYIKRKTDLSTLSAQNIRSIEDTINFRPRKCLDYKTPYEVFYGKTVALAL